MADLPPKLFFRIGEVAGLVGVEPHVLRYWEREFRSIRPTKSAKGQRVYSRKDVENLLRVRDLLYRDGFTIAGAKKKLQRTVSGQLDAETEAAADTEVNEERENVESSRCGAPRTQPDLADVSDEDSSVSLHEALEATPSVAVVEEAQQETAGEPQNVREKLLALRGEVEDFLAELSFSSSPRDRDRGTSRSAPVSGTAARGSGSDRRGELEGRNPSSMNGGADAQATRRDERR